MSTMQITPEDVSSQNIVAEHANQTVAALGKAREALFAQLGAMVFADAAIDLQLRDRYEALMGHIETVSALMDDLTSSDAPAGQDADDSWVDTAQSVDTPDEIWQLEPVQPEDTFFEDLQAEPAQSENPFAEAVQAELAQLEDVLPEAMQADSEPPAAEEPVECEPEASPAVEAPGDDELEALLSAVEASVQQSTEVPQDFFESVTSHEELGPNAIPEPDPEPSPKPEATGSQDEPLSDASSADIDFSWFEEHALRETTGSDDPSITSGGIKHFREPDSASKAKSDAESLADAMLELFQDGETQPIPEPEPLELTTLLPSIPEAEPSSSPETSASPKHEPTSELPTALASDSPRKADPEQGPDASAANPPAAKPQLVCSKCGAPLKPTNKFCGNCGERVIQGKPADAPARLTCPQCGEPVGAHDTFCMMCGTRLSGAATTHQSRPKPQPTRPKSQPKSLRCPHCHEPILPGDVFCQSCGTRL